MTATRIKNTFQVITQHVFLISTGHGNWDLSLVAEILLSDPEKYACYVWGPHNIKIKTIF
jgi:hypothetical protein